MLSKPDPRATGQHDTAIQFLFLAILTTGIFLFPSTMIPRDDRSNESVAQPRPESAAVGADHPAVEYSRARAVSVADVIGTVKVRRPGLPGEDVLMVNFPIQEGSELSSTADSFAGIAFEHDSAVIIGAHSRVLFHQLALDANGNRLTGVTIEHGLATFHLSPQHHAPTTPPPSALGATSRSPVVEADVYEVKIAEARATIQNNCRFRIDVKHGYVRVEVFKGSLIFATPVQSVELTAGRFLEHRLGGTETAFDVHHGIVKDQWDGWVALEEQKVLAAAKLDATKARQPEDLNAILRLKRSYPSGHSGNTIPHPPRGRY